MSLFHKVRRVTPLPGFKLSVLFATGETKVYDVEPLFARLKAFQQLEKRPILFEDVRVDVGGCGIVWNDDLDLSCDELWEHGVAVQTPFDGLMSLAEATELWGLNESTLRKAIHYGKLVEDVDARKYGKQWVVSTASMVREYGSPEYRAD